MAPMVNQGLSAAIYTQTTDVEGEVNGLITYDREKVKMDVSDLKEINELMFHKPVKTMDILPDSEVAPQKCLFLTKGQMTWIQNLKRIKNHKWDGQD